MFEPQEPDTLASSVPVTVNMLHSRATHNQAHRLPHCHAPGLSTDMQEINAVMRGLQAKGWKDIQVIGSQKQGYGLKITIPKRAKE